MSDAEWYLTLGEREIGPFTVEQLKTFAAQGKIRRNTEVRKEDAERCVLAADVDGVFDAPPSTPRPLPLPGQQETAPPPARKRPVVPSGRSTDIDRPSKSERRGWIKVEAGLTVSFFSLIIGATAFATMVIVILVGIRSPQPMLRLFMGAGIGSFWSTILFWCVLAVAASYVSLVTGWFVCCAVSDRTEAYSPIQGTIGCVALALLLLLLMQLITMILTPSTPKLFSRDRPATPAEMQRRRTEMQEFGQKVQSRAKLIATISKAFFWLASLALIGSFAVFALFLGAVGRYLGNDNHYRSALYFCILPGTYALWITLRTFLLEIDSANMMKLTFILSIALALATYGCLIWLVYRARELVREHS